MKFSEYIKSLSNFVSIEESEKIVVYHGSDVTFNNISAKYMLLDGSNAQEGVGIYFGDFDTAETYGKHVMSIEIDPKMFIDSHSLLSDNIKKKQIIALCKDMYKSDKESFFYKVSDWVPVEDVSDVNDYVIDEFAESQMDEMLRYFTADFAMTFGIETFINSWNKHMKNIHGTFNKQHGTTRILCSDEYKI